LPRWPSGHVGNAASNPNAGPVAYLLPPGERGSGWTQIGLVVAAVVILAAALGSILISSGGNDQQVAAATLADRNP
jgi:hypothetical protein